MIVGWTLFLGSTAYILYKLSSGLLLSMEYNSAFYLRSMDMKRWIISLIIFFTGVFFMFKASEKTEKS